MLGRIDWLRIVVAAAFTEVGLFAVAKPLDMSANGHAILLDLAIPLCVIATFLSGWWAARAADRLWVLHGLLVGAVAALLYWGLTWNVSVPTAYVVGNFLKLIGGAAGGLMAQSRRRNKPAPAK